MIDKAKENIKKIVQHEREQKIANMQNKITPGLVVMFDKALNYYKKNNFELSVKHFNKIKELVNKWPLDDYLQKA